MLKISEKIVATIMGIVLCYGAFSYIQNYDMFQMVGDTNMVTGYATLSVRLQDEQWVDSTCEKWEYSSSPIMRKLYAYLTNQSDVSPVPDIGEGRVLASVCMTTSLASFPLFILSIACSVDRKRLKELYKHV